MVYPSNHGSPLRIQRALNGVQPYQVTRFLGIIQRHSLSINIHLFPCFINVVFDRHPTIASRSLVLIIRLLASNRRVSRKMIVFLKIFQNSRDARIIVFRITFCKYFSLLLSTLCIKNIVEIIWI